jgi:aspartyl-tRNA(Asn)/glutamyl-tRNA(Gln) amidotransferase subunit A
MKPTYGRVSRYGMIAFASSLDQAGPVARSVPDAAVVLASIAGYDRRDSTSVDVPVPDYLAATGRGVKGMRVGLPREYFAERVDASVKSAVMKALAALTSLGAESLEISLPHTEYALSTYYLIAPAEASSNLARYDGVRYGHRADGVKGLIEMMSRTRAEGFGEEVKRRIMIGTYALSAGYYDAYYGKAQKVRTLLRRDFAEAFARVDVILTPTAPTPAFCLGEKVDDPLTMYLSDIYTIPASLAGIPGISVPCGLSPDGLPIGAQLLGKHFDEESLLAAAAAIEREIPMPRVAPLGG